MNDTFTPVVQATDDALNRIASNVEELRRRRQERAALESHLERLNKDIADLEVELIPDLFVEAGIQEFTTTDGVKVGLKQLVTASWPKEPAKAKEAIQWLEATGNEGVVKAAVVADFGRGNRALAYQIYDMLRKDNRATVKLDESVHHQTLSALMRACIKDGVNIDTELFNLFVRTTTVIKEPKDV